MNFTKTVLCALLVLLSVSTKANDNEITLNGRTSTLAIEYYPNILIDYVMSHGESYYLIRVVADDKISGISKTAKISKGEVKLKTGTKEVPLLELSVSYEYFQAFSSMRMNYGSNPLSIVCSKKTKDAKECALKQFKNS